MSRIPGAIGPCITSGCDQLAVVGNHRDGLWCSKHELEISLEAEFGFKEFDEWLAAGAPSVDEPQTWEYPELPPWIDEEPFYRDDDEAMA